jgi:hypothetical protein
MLSRSDSCEWPLVDVHRVSSASGAVLERPVCERVFGGIMSGPSKGVSLGPASRGWRRSLDLTGAEGEVFLGAGKAGDMEATLVRY